MVVNKYIGGFFLITMSKVGAKIRDVASDLVLELQKLNN
jgi:hypothetical protein